MGFNANGKKPRVDVDLKNAFIPQENIEKFDKEQEPIIEPSKVVSPVEPKPEKKVKEKKTYVKVASNTDSKSLSLRVSQDFKLAIKMYCLDNDTTEKDLIYAVMEKLKDEMDVEALLSIKYDTDNKGRDTSMRINAPVKDKSMKFLIKATMQNQVSKGYLVAQAIAHEISYKKTL